MKTRTKKSAKRLEDYYINNGWFDVKANYDINKKENKRAEIEYLVETGDPYIIDTISEQIKSPVIDSLYKKIKKIDLLKRNEQYKTANFANGAK